MGRPWILFSAQEGKEHTRLENSYLIQKEQKKTGDIENKKRKETDINPTVE
jgi:hypothetical protein